MTDRPDAFTRAREMRDRGVLPESANRLTDGGTSSHFDHREIEYGAVVDGRVVPEWQAYAIRDGVPQRDWVGFYCGWYKAMSGHPPHECITEASAVGWRAYPRAKYRDPWEGLEESTQDERDEKRRKIQGGR